MYFLLFYDYVDNIIERRAPFREAHLGLVRDFVDRGELVLAGAFADPVDGAALAFRVEDRSTVEAFVASDPYVVQGLVTGWRIRPWTVVVGSALQPESGN
ncbi:MAG: YciI-like protein [Acidobacteria bacterium]|nr:YciI-like protein [Acidobacteriota bacterium]